MCVWIHLTQIWHVGCQPIFYIFLPDFSSFCWAYVLAFHPLLIVGIDRMTYVFDLTLFCFVFTVGGVPMTRVSRSSSMDGADIPLRKRSMSMEEADKPLGIYSSSPARTAPLSTSPKSGIQMSTSPPRIPE